MLKVLLDSRAVLAALLAALCVARVTRWIVQPPSRLGPRVRPYTVTSRSALGHGAEALALMEPPGTATGVLMRLFGPPVLWIARWLGNIVERGGDEPLLLRLRQAGLLLDVPEARRALQYRVQLFAAAAAATFIGLVVGLVLLGSVSRMLVGGAVGLLFGLTWQRGRLDRLIRKRREQMRVELYTLNHLLAMHIRVGGGVIQALQQLAQRGTGAVIDEIADVLRAHRGGIRVGAALTRAAAQTPEPHAARTYKLLATGAEHGADLAKALMDLSRDLRSQRREDLRRMAVRQRGAMLIPIVLILAPILLVFIAAPLPSIVFGGLTGK